MRVGAGDGIGAAWQSFTGVCRVTTEMVFSTTMHCLAKSRTLSWCPAAPASNCWLGRNQPRRTGRRHRSRSGSLADKQPELESDALSGTALVPEGKKAGQAPQIVATPDNR